MSQTLIITDDCIGCGQCESAFPDIFKVDGAKAIVIEDAVIPTDDDEKMEEILGTTCPVSAIKKSDASTAKDDEDEDEEDDDVTLADSKVDLNDDEDADNEEEKF